MVCTSWKGNLMARVRKEEYDLQLVSEDYTSISCPPREQSRQGITLLPLHTLHCGPIFVTISINSAFCSHPAAQASRSLRFFTLTHSWEDESQVATSRTNVSLPFFLFWVAWKCLQPKVLSIAVHLLPISLVVSTWFMTWYPPTGKCPFPSHEPHGVVPLPPHRLHTPARE